MCSSWSSSTAVLPREGGAGVTAVEGGAPLSRLRHSSAVLLPARHTRDEEEKQSARRAALGSGVKLQGATEEQELAPTSNYNTDGRIFPVELLNSHGSKLATDISLARKGETFAAVCDRAGPGGAAPTLRCLHVFLSSTTALPSPEMTCLLSCRISACLLAASKLLQAHKIVCSRHLLSRAV